MQAMAQDPDLAKGLSTSRVGGRRNLCLRVEVAGREADSTMIAPTESEMVLTVAPLISGEHGLLNQLVTVM